MKILIIFALAVGILSEDFIYDESDSIEESSGSTEEQATENSGLFINRGSRAAKGQFPYQVRVKTAKTDGKNRACGGSLIGKNWIVTAAHCVRDLITLKAYMGAIKRSSTKITRTVGASCAYTHDHYQKSNHHRNDIALIYIPTVPYTSKIQPIKLPSIVPPYSDYAGSYGIVSGWGVIQLDSKFTDEYLRYANISILSNSDCRKTYRRLTDSNICIATPNSNTCNGDSGSPLALASSALLVGLNSYTKEGCFSGKPRVFIRITSYLEWIRERTGIFY